MTATPRPPKKKTPKEKLPPFADFSAASGNFFLYFCDVPSPPVHSRRLFTAPAFHLQDEWFEHSTVQRGGTKKKKKKVD